MSDSSVDTFDLINSTRSEDESDCEKHEIVPMESPHSPSLTGDPNDNEDTKSEILDLVPVEAQPYPERSSWAANNESQQLSDPDLEDDIDTSDLDHLEPKLREAWIEMRRLDKRLAALVKKEKKARLETKALVENNKKEWEQFKLTSNYVESKIEAQITQKFYALSYPDIDDDELMADRKPDEDDGQHTPVFKTQVPFYEETTLTDREKETKHKLGSKSKKSDDFKSTATHTTAESIYSGDSKAAKSSSTTTSKKEKNDKDFIKRNIQLAKDQGGVLAMTDEEKSRLKSLLSDMGDDINTDGRGEVQATVTDEKLTYMVDYEPNLVVLEQGDGFTPTREEADKLRRIEQQLQQRRGSSQITNDSDKNASSSWVDFHSQIAPSTDNALVQIRLNDEFDEDEFGDRFIREARVHREVEMRLKFIDLRLKEIQDQAVMGKTASSVDFASNDGRKVSIAEESNISEDQMKKLLSDCYSELGVNETDFQAFDNESEKSRIPLLTENQLRSLLEELGASDIVTSGPDSRSTNHSYYEEALKIVESRPKLSEEARTMDEESNQDGHQNKEFMGENEDNSYWVRNESFVQSPKLPPIFPESSRNSRLSMASRNSFAESSSSSLVLPKINDRHLPK